MNPQDRIVLASASPRRSAVLTVLGIDHDVRPARVDELPQSGESPEAHAERLARAKAEAVSARMPERWILAGDTVVSTGEELLGKPGSVGQAVEMLVRLAGTSHVVVSGLAVARPGRTVRAPGVLLSGTRSTTVRFREFAREEAEAYAATGEPLDKAGAYGIQGLGAALVEEIHGDYTNVVGLPVSLLLRLLSEAGRPFSFPSS